VVVPMRDNAHRGLDEVAGRRRVVCLDYLCLLLILRESDVSSLVLFLVFVKAWTWVHVRISDAQSTAHIRSHATLKTLLVHRVAVSLIGAGAGHIDTSGLHWWFDTEGKFRNFTNTVLKVSRVPKVKVTHNSVTIGGR